MEHGECSRPNEDNDVWAKLVPADSKYAKVDITLQEMVICSEITSSSPEKHEWCIITRNSDQNSAKIKNISYQTKYKRSKYTTPIAKRNTGAIVVDGIVVEKGATLDIKCGSELIPGHDRKDFLAYSLKVYKRTQKQSEKSLMIPIDVEHSKCSICLNTWHDVVTVAPCLHNFCNGCLSEWLRRSKEKQHGVLCPHCRASIHSVGRNHFLHNIEEAILQSFSSLKRSDEELVQLDKYASIQSNIVLGSQNIQSRKRPLSYSTDESEDETDLLCPQCETQLGGFRCDQTTAHLQCHACGQMMPSRPDIHVPQYYLNDRLRAVLELLRAGVAYEAFHSQVSGHITNAFFHDINCRPGLGCNRAFCAAYWQSQGVGITDVYGVCSLETFKPICEHTISRIPDSAHQNNHHEQYVTEMCIQQTGKTLQAVISDLIVKFSNGEIERSKAPLNQVSRITSWTHICKDCYCKLVSYLLFWFRISIPRHLLPRDASGRENCWYGYACRTQHNSIEHAQKRNHVCHPTRGNQDRVRTRSSIG